MARPVKIGLDYFNLNTNVFSDRKIRRLVHVFGTKGFTIYIFVLCAIFDDKGYYVQCDDDFLFDIQDRFNLKENLVSEVINSSVNLGLFSKELFNKFQILTSTSIQERYKLIMQSSKRIFSISEKYNLLVNMEVTTVNSEETLVNSEETLVNSEFGTQRKGNKKKGKEINSIISASQAQRDRIFEIFFFKSFINPDLEVQRFLDHYSKTGWIDKNGNQVKDLFAAARNWKQVNPDPGYQLPPEMAKPWEKSYSKFTELAKNGDARHFLELQPTFYDGSTLKIRVNNAKSLELLENNLLQEYQQAIITGFNNKPPKIYYHAART